MSGAEAAEVESDGALQSHLAQARFFIKKHWYEDARAELEKALADSEGRSDATAWYLLATVDYQLCDIEGARTAAERAHSFSDTDQELGQAAGLVAFLEQQFGIVALASTHEGLAGHLELELVSDVFDVELKNYLGRLRERESASVVLPLRLGLPVGSYRINGQAVEVTAGQAIDLVIPPTALTSGKGSAVQLAQANLGLGMNVWFGPDTENLDPSLTFELGVTQPIGPLVAGVMLDWGPRTYAIANGTTQSSGVAPSLGGEVGVALRGGPGLTLRPSLGYRFGYVPGIELSCTASGDEWACGERPADLAVYAVGRAHVPFVDLAADFFDHRRKSGVGFGVNLVGEHALGTLAHEAEARMTDGDVVVYSVDPGARNWSATGLRFLVHFAVEF